jgi:hypothetical protein
MAPPFPFGMSVTVRRGGGVDKFGDPDPDSVTTHVVAGCAVAPRTSTEDTTGRGDTVIVGLTLYGPYDADIAATDVVELPGGDRYQVVGEPGRWASPMSRRRPGLSVALERVTG